MRLLLLLLACSLAGPAAAHDVWWAVCPPDHRGWGPFGTVDGCRERLEAVQRTCETPLIRETQIVGKDMHPIGVDKPNPAFLRLATLCRTTLNATQCGCLVRPAPGGLPSDPDVP